MLLDYTNKSILKHYRYIIKLNIIITLNIKMFLFLNNIKYISVVVIYAIILM